MRGGVDMRGGVEGGMGPVFLGKGRVLECLDCGSDDLDSVIDSSVVLRLQVTVSNDESVIEREHVSFSSVNMLVLNEDNTHLIVSSPAAKCANPGCDHPG